MLKPSRDISPSRDTLAPIKAHTILPLHIIHESFIPMIFSSRLAGTIFKMETETGGLPRLPGT